MSSSFDIGDLARMASSMGLSPDFIREALGSAKRNTVDQYREDYLSELKAQKEQFDRESQLKPERPPPLDRDTLLFEISANRDSGETHSGFNHRSTTIGFPIESSTSPISELRSILLSEMMVRQTHKGRYLLCRIIGAPSRLVATMMGVEDVEGNVARLSFYNYPTLFYAKQGDLDALLPLGTILLIREPTYKMSLSAPTAFIRVDSPSDVVFLEKDDPVLRDIQWKYHLSTPLTPSSVEGWRARGVSEFKENRLLQAAVCFANALKLDTKSQILFLNRAEVYLRLGWYFSALHDTKEAIRLGPITDDLLRRKAVMRSIRANYGLCRYEEVVRIANENPNDTDCKGWLKRAKSRIVEKTTGNYDWFALITEGKDVNARPEVAEYCGPVIVKERVGEPGVMGVFVTRDVEIGELLMVARPLASILPGDTKTNEFFISLNYLTNEAYEITHHLVYVSLIQRLCDDAQANAIVHSMYAGPSHTRTTYPPEAVEQHPLAHPLRPVVDIDVTRVQGVASLNQFGLAHPIEPQTRDTVRDMSGGTGVALYVLPSFCNHSCVPTANRITAGDIMVVRAAQHLKAGDEVTLGYVAVDEPERREGLEKKWHFTCKCTLCEDDEADGKQNLMQRGQLCEEAKSIVDSVRHRQSEVSKQEWTQHYARMKGIVEAMEKTYKKDKDAQKHQFRSHMVQVYTAVSFIAIGASAVAGLRNEDVMDAEMKVLENSGFVITNKLLRGRSEEMPLDKFHSYCSCILPITRAVQSCLGIAVGALDRRSPARTRAWVNAAKWVFGVTIANDHRLFKDEFNSMISDMGLQDYC